MIVTPVGAEIGDGQPRPAAWPPWRTRGQIELGDVVDVGGVGAGNHQHVAGRGREDVHDRDRERILVAPRVDGSSPAMIRQNRQSCMRPISHTRNYSARVTDVTISIVSGGDADLLAACLASIPRAARGDVTVQIVVVDNRTGGRARPADRPRPGEVEWIRNDPHAGVRREPQPGAGRAPTGATCSC